MGAARRDDSLFMPRAWSTYIGAIVSLVQEGLLSFATDLSLTTGGRRLVGAGRSDDARPTPCARGHLRRRQPADGRRRRRLVPLSHGSGLGFAAGGVLLGGRLGRGHRRPRVITVTPEGAERPVPLHPRPHGRLHLQEEPARGPRRRSARPEACRSAPAPTGSSSSSPATGSCSRPATTTGAPKPVARRIVFRQIPDRQTRLLAMRNGDIDGTFDLALVRHRAVEGTRQRRRHRPRRRSASSSLTLDHSAPPFDDVHVRRAIAYSVDRVGLVKALLKGNGEPAAALNPPEIWAGVLPREEVEAFYATIRATVSISTRPGPSWR